MIDIECVVRCDNLYGESPVWSVAEQALYWVDVTAPAIHRFRPADKTTNRWPMPEHVGSIGLRASGGFVAGTRSGIHAIDPTSGRQECLARPDLGGANIRFNDGKCDRAGRFWSGTMDDATFAPVGALYRIGIDHGCTKLDEGFIIVNGIAWSPDDRLMYVADSRREVVYAYDFDLASGSIANRRKFISTEDVPGRVDGATVATDGTYWCAHVRGGQVAQYDPTGRLMTAIPLPVKYPLMCTFGGPELETLYVTTSRALVTEAEAPDQPLAGSLFAIHGTGARGIAEPLFRG